MAVALKLPATMESGSWNGRERDRRQCCECPVAVAQENRDGARRSIGHGEVDAAVTREVARDERIGPPGTGIGGRALECAVAVAQEDVDLARARVGDRQVGAAVVVEIGGHDRRGGAPGGNAMVKDCWNVPSPLPGRIVMLSEPG